MKDATAREVAGLRHLGPATMVECDPEFQEERSVLVGMDGSLREPALTTLTRSSSESSLSETVAEVEGRIFIALSFLSRVDRSATLDRRTPWSRLMVDNGRAQMFQFGTTTTSTLTNQISRLE